MATWQYGDGYVEGSKVSFNSKEYTVRKDGEQTVYDGMTTGAPVTIADGEDSNTTTSNNGGSLGVQILENPISNVLADGWHTLTDLGVPSDVSHLIVYIHTKLVNNVGSTVSFATKHDGTDYIHRYFHNSHHNLDRYSAQIIAPVITNHLGEVGVYVIHRNLDTIRIDGYIKKVESSGNSGGNSGGGTVEASSETTTVNTMMFDETVQFNKGFVLNNTGVANITSPTNLELQAANRVLIVGAPLQLPRMTTSQRDAIVAPLDGDMIYNITIKRFEGYEDGKWVSIRA